MKVKNKKSKEFYCRCDVVKLCLLFSLFIFSPFQCISCTSCQVKNFYYFLDDSHLPVDSFTFLTRTLYKTWKSHYRQLQFPILIFNKKALVNISSISISKNQPLNLLSFVSRIVVNKFLKIQFVIFNPWKVPWNWIAFYQNYFVISPGLLFTWLEATVDDLQTRPLRQTLLILQNNGSTV